MSTFSRNEWLRVSSFCISFREFPNFTLSQFTRECASRPGIFNTFSSKGNSHTAIGSGVSAWAAGFATAPTPPITRAWESGLLDWIVVGSDSVNPRGSSQKNCANQIAA